MPVQSPARPGAILAFGVTPFGPVADLLNRLLYPLRPLRSGLACGLRALLCCFQNGDRLWTANSDQTVQSFFPDPRLRIVHCFRQELNRLRQTMLPDNFHQDGSGLWILFGPERVNQNRQDGLVSLDQRMKRILPVGAPGPFDLVGGIGLQVHCSLLLSARERV
jgi:hypothetical protein